MIVTKLRIGDANTMMAEGGIQAADKENDSPVQHYLDDILDLTLRGKTRACNKASCYGSAGCYQMVE